MSHATAVTTSSVWKLSGTLSAYNSGSGTHLGHVSGLRCVFPRPPLRSAKHEPRGARSPQRILFANDKTLEREEMARKTPFGSVCVPWPTQLRVPANSPALGETQDSTFGTSRPLGTLADRLERRAFLISSSADFGVALPRHSGLRETSPEPRNKRSSSHCRSLGAVTPVEGAPRHEDKASATNAQTPRYSKQKPVPTMA